MARPLQKKKNKSSLHRVRQKPKSKAVNIKSNPIVARNWDQSLTLRQNYKNLGLSSRLNSSTGGIEKKSKVAPSTEHDGLKVPSNTKSTQLEPARVKVVRDPETGAITAVVPNDAAKWKRNPLNDPLNSDEGDEEDDDEDDDMEAGRRRIIKTFEGGGIVSELEESSKYEKRKSPRKQSQREQEWIERLVGRYGEDFGKMVRDGRLNPMQQSKGDLRKRVATWRKEKGNGGREEAMDES